MNCDPAQALWSRDSPPTHDDTMTRDWHGASGVTAPWSHTLTSSSSASSSSSRPRDLTGTTTTSSWSTARWRGWKVRPRYLDIRCRIKNKFCKFNYLNTAVIRATATLILQNISGELRTVRITLGGLQSCRHYHWIFCKSTKIQNV